MEMIRLWFQHYPMLAGMAFGVLILAGLGLVFGVLMHQAGLSLKPLLWFLVLIGLIGGPQAIMQVLDVVAFQRQAGQPAMESVALRPVSWKTVFGPEADPDLITDPRVPLQAVLAGAQAASLSFNAEGESALAARFDSPQAVAQALAAYVAFFQLDQADGSNETGRTGQRYAGTGEWNHVVAAGNELYAWTGPSRASVESRRVQSLGAIPATAKTQRAHEARLVTGSLGWNIMLPFAVVNLIVVVLWFFWGAAWAARVMPEATLATSPMGATNVRQRILAAYGADSPVQVSTNADGSLTLDWRYGDAQWLDLMRIHKFKRTERLVLQLDEADHTVRVREYWSAFEASAGADGAHMQWQAASGMQFFRLEQERVFGVQLDAQGRATGELSKTIRFDLQAMKRPALQAVLNAGWNWQPTLLAGPAWLRWLTG